MIRPHILDIRRPRSKTFFAAARGGLLFSKKNCLLPCLGLYSAIMPKNDTDLLTKSKPKVERPKLYKVILVNDDFTPREFVVRVLRAEFGMNESQARQVMMTAHQRGLCVVAVFVRDIAETKATRATDAARKEGYPLLFTTEPEE
jgi:ATP-dependent Clp protease adaptor protein ClpS